MSSRCRACIATLVCLFGAMPPSSAQDDLAARVSVLESLVKQLQAEIAQLRAQKTATAPKAPPPSPGFVVRSEDGKSRMSLRGLVHLDSRTYTSGGGGPDSFTARRVRPIFEGDLQGKARFSVVPDFGDGRVVLQDAYAETPLSASLTLRAGKSKTPLSIERLQSTMDSPFPEKSVGNGLQPNRDLGFQLMGRADRDRLTYAVGVFNGLTDGGSADADAGDHKDFAARILAEPWKHSGNPALKGLGLGLAASAGTREDSLGSVAYRTAGRTPFFQYLANATATGSHTRWSPHLLYYNGPFGMLAEAVRSDQGVALGAASSRLRNEGWVFATSYFLTGEANGFRNPAPNRSSGAWELAARYSGISLDPRAFTSGLADPAVSASSAHALSLGLNWHLMRGSKWQFFYEHTWLDRPVKLGPITSDHEGVLFTRMQVGF